MMMMIVFLQNNYFLIFIFKRLYSDHLF